jgi:hypothetical protein
LQLLIVTNTNLHNYSVFILPFDVFDKKSAFFTNF